MTEPAQNDVLHIWVFSRSRLIKISYTTRADHGNGISLSNTMVVEMGELTEPSDIGVFGYLTREIVSLWRT